VDQKEMISFDGADSGTNSDVMVSFFLDVGTFVERLWNICGTFVELCGKFVEHLWKFCSFTVLILLFDTCANIWKNK
jgi:hypothetical protein